MKELAAAIGQMSQEDIAAFEAAGTFRLLDIDLVAEDVDIITEDMPGWLVANNGVLTIALDIELNDALIEEGIARELINRIQNLRKTSGLEITDRIAIEIERREEIAAAVEHCGSISHRRCWQPRSNWWTRSAKHKCSIWTGTA